METWKLCVFLVGILLVSSSVSAGNFIAFQGNVNEGDVALTDGNLSVAIFDAQTGGNLIYNSTTDFDNAISGGVYDIMLGNGSNELNLNYGEKYYLEMFINGELFGFDGSARQIFESAVGNITSAYLDPGAQVNSSTWWNSVSGWASKWFYQSGNEFTFNETMLNLSIDDREDDTLGDVGACNNAQVVKWNITSTAWYCSDISAEGASDIDAVLTDGPYLFGGSTTGSVSLLLNETKLNASILAVAGDGNFAALTGGNAINGTQDFEGGWTQGGLTISAGDLFAQTVYVYNLTSLAVNQLNINGSIIPSAGFDNIFDIGSSTLRWRDLFIGRNANISGNLTVGDNVLVTNIVSGNKRVGIGISPEANLHVYGTNAQIRIASTSASGSPSLYFYQSSSGKSSIVHQDAGDMFIFNSLAGGLQLSTKSKTRLLVHEDGNIGIGIYQLETPSALLEVNGTGVLLNVHENSNSFLFINSTSGKVGIGTITPSTTFDVGGGDFTVNTTSGTILIGTSPHGFDPSIRLLVHTNDATIYNNSAGLDTFLEQGDMVIQNINNTVDSFSALSLVAGKNTASVGRIAVINVAGSGNTISDMVFMTRRSDTTITEKMRITSTGNVGIGTASPTSKFHVYGGNITLQNSSSTEENYFKFGRGGYMYDNGTSLILGHD